jgi:nucleoside-diphosphate-sugar epimerase
MTRNTKLMMGFRPEWGAWSVPASGVYVVTGGGGFIGSHLVDRLVLEGYRVRVLDDFSTGRRENLAGVGDIDLVEGDIRDRSTCRDVCRGASVVLHLAARTSVKGSLEDPFLTNDVNVGGTLNMLDAAREAGVRRFIFASSSAVYGDSPVLPKVESMHETPMSPYGASKLAGEKYCLAWSSSRNLPTVSLRYFNVFGPRQDPHSPYAAVIPRFIDTLRKGKAPVIHGDGNQTRDFTFVDDVVQATLLAAWSPDAAGDYFNIGGGRRYSVRQVTETLIRLT